MFIALLFPTHLASLYHLNQILPLMVIFLLGLTKMRNLFSLVKVTMVLLNVGAGVSLLDWNLMVGCEVFALLVDDVFSVVLIEDL